jgi:flavin-dependent dehydrogenase
MAAVIRFSTGPSLRAPWRAGRHEAPVVIIGAGPAGAVAAWQLARSGVRTILLDKARFPRPKVCGGCLNEAALRALRRIGLDDVARAAAAQPLHRLRLHAGSRQVDLALPGGALVSRAEFDAALVQRAVAAGAAFFDQAMAERCTLASDCRLVSVRIQGQTVLLRASVVVAADGLAGRIMASQPGVERWQAGDARLGAYARLSYDGSPEPGVIQMVCGAGGYVGAVRLPDGTVNIAAALDRRRVRRARGAARAALEIWNSAGLRAPRGWCQACWVGTPPLTRRVWPVALPRLLAIGDAAGYVEPFTGEGMAWAIAGGEAIAPLARAGARGWEGSIERLWRLRSRQLLGARQRTCAWIARGLRSSWVTGLALRALRVQPRLADGIVRRINALAQTG